MSYPTSMATRTGKTTQVAIRIEDDVFARIDTLVGLLSPAGMTMPRSEVIRAAIVRGVEVLEAGVGQDRRVLASARETANRTDIATDDALISVAENLTEEVKDAIRGTPLENAARELVALAKLPPAEQMPAVKAMKLKAMKAHRAATKKTPVTKTKK